MVNYIVKLRSIFSSLDPVASPAPSLPCGNPAAHPSVSKYLQSIREEQAQARVTPKQAVPFLFDKLLLLYAHIKAALSQRDISPKTCYIYARDLAFFCLDFYSGHRASDLGRLKTGDVLCLPDNNGLLFRHTFGKTLPGKHTHMFAAKPSSSPSCPMANLKLYVLLLSDRMQINLRHGFLFRATDHKGHIGNAPYGVHSLRAGCSITLSLLGASTKAIAKHNGWRSVATAEYYTQTDTV